MRSFVSAAACLLTAVAMASSAAEPPPSRPLLIAADKIYPSPDVAPLAHGSVLLRDSRIVAVADERSRIAIPAGTHTSECRGVVVAGFQNSHVHFMGGAFDGAANRPVAEIEQAVESMLTKYGFTTVFDTGSALADTLSIRARIENGEIRGPRILTAGWPLYPKDGIPFYLRDLPKQVLDGLQQPADAAEARADVRDNLAAGADGTKLFIHTSPDGTSPRFMALETARAAAEETHARGKLVLAHPTSIEGIRGALAAGVDVIVHTTLGERLPWDDTLTREMVAKNMSVIPTFMLWPYELAKQNVPAEVIDRLVAATLAELRGFVAAGGQVLFGTDVGYMREFDPTPEYLYMEKAGLSSVQILASLTTEPAKRWKEDGRRGKVEPGMDADLVVLAADPAVDVRHFAQVRCVFRAGKLIYASTPKASAPRASSEAP
jgi:imidazolonepropionase-like amidohydrolase